MAYNGPVIVPDTRRHEKYDSALDGVDSKHDSSRLRELEEENGLLAQKATAAAQRFADYENEIRVLKTRLREQQERHKVALANQVQDQPVITPEKPGLSRFGSFMRKPSFTPPTAPSIRDPSAREQELEASITKERAARMEAEKRVKEIDAEMEDLSASLFQQANDMVSKERKENSRLKEAIATLESAGNDASAAVKKENERLRHRLQILEQRDMDRKRRLDKLEAAQKRIDRVRSMLVPR